MCRLLGVVASRRAPLPDLLPDDLDHYLALACEHHDGWGIGHRDAEGRIAIVKEPVSAEHSEELRPLLARTVTDAAVFHLRLASGTLGVNHANTHPFGDERRAFVHNGYFNPSDALDDLLGPELLAEAAGDTDSERFYLAIRQRIDAGILPQVAIVEAAAEVRDEAAEIASLNCLLLTENGMYAYTEHDPESEVMARRGADFFDLGYRVDADRVVVASSGWSQPAEHWRRLGERQVLVVDRRTLRTDIHEA